MTADTQSAVSTDAVPASGVPGVTAGAPYGPAPLPADPPGDASDDAPAGYDDGMDEPESGVAVLPDEVAPQDGVASPDAAAEVEDDVPVEDAADGSEVAEDGTPPPGDASGPAGDPDGPVPDEVVASEVAERLGAVVGEDVEPDPAEFAAAAVLDVLRASGWADATEAAELRAEATRTKELLNMVVRDHRAREASMAGTENQQLHWLVPLLRAAHGVAFGSLGAKVALRTAVQDVPPEVLAQAGLRIDYGVEHAAEDGHREDGHRDDYRDDYRDDGR
jgi:hypothetical protein